jgi:hypothetical protein
MLYAAVVLACAGLNRLRGVDTLKVLPGRPLYYVSIVVAALGFLLHGPWGIAYGAAYLLWGSFGWGHLYTLGRFVPDRPWGWDERLFFRLGGENYYLAFGLRQAVMLPLASMNLWAVLFPPLAVGVYELSCRLHPSNPIWIAEILVGILWGLLLISGV